MTLAQWRQGAARPVPFRVPFGAVFRGGGRSGGGAKCLLFQPRATADTGRSPLRRQALYPTELRTLTGLMPVAGPQF